MNIIPLIDLNGRSIAKWVAMEMALSDGAHGDRSILWEHESIPYLQLTSIDVLMEDGARYRLLSQADDGSGFYGLYLGSIDALDTPSTYEAGSIFRTRELSELPVGPVTVAIAQADGPNAILRIEVNVNSHTISCWAAEVYEENDGSFRMVGADESILLQLDGIRPKNNFQRMPFGAAAEKAHEN